MSERIPLPETTRDDAQSAHPGALRDGRPLLQCWLLSTGRLSLLIMLFASLSGCAYDPRRFKLPEIWPRHPELERRAAEFHDPFPDDSIGPSADSRPRGFGRQRSETRRAAELKSVHILDGADRLPSTNHQPDRRFSQVVKP